MHYVAWSLISRETLKELEQSGTLPIAVDADFERFIYASREHLDERLAASDVKAKGGLLPDVMLEKGVLKITPIEKSTPAGSQALARRLYAMLPRIRITDLLSEVAQWTLFTDCFTHLRTGGTATDPRILMASLLADGLNLGLTRMAEACSIASYRPPVPRSPPDTAWASGASDQRIFILRRHRVDRRGQQRDGPPDGSACVEPDHCN